MGLISHTPDPTTSNAKRPDLPMPSAPRKPFKQVAALPVSVDMEGQLRVLLITSRETQRFIIPKGWPMKGRKDHEAAAIEAEQEAGLVGRIRKGPIGTYTYWKRRAEHFDLCRVKVFVLEFWDRLPDWPEKGQRRGAWLLVDEAADLVDEYGLVEILHDLPRRLAAKRSRGKPLKASLPR